jgi:signal transduction histidine kinase
MTELMLIFAVSLVGALIVAVPGSVVLRLLRQRSITVYICVLLAVSVLSMLAGVIGVAGGMFISRHDLRVLLIVVSIAGAVSIGVGVWLGGRLARDAMWAAELRERERQMEANRRDLVAWVSHDLRTPLAGMRAMVEALEDGIIADAETIADYHRRIRAETDRMAALVDDLFELSRINAGALRLSPAAVSLGDVVSDAVASAAPVAAARGVKLAATANDWPIVIGSEPELSRVVANLLRNAIRHTPPDGTVTLSGGRDAANGWVVVTDGCGGIPEADLPKVFDVAFRGAPARTPAVVDAASAGGGGGLGLAIVKGLVEAHRGTVAVSNIVGGCAFEIRLPAA